MEHTRKVIKIVDCPGCNDVGDSLSRQSEDGSLQVSGLT
jgi:hypothetical protein